MSARVQIYGDNHKGIKQAMWQEEVDSCDVRGSEMQDVP